MHTKYHKYLSSLVTNTAIPKFYIQEKINIMLQNKTIFRVYFNYLQIVDYMYDVCMMTLSLQTIHCQNVTNHFKITKSLQFCMAFYHELSTVSLLKLSSFIFWGWTYLWSANTSPERVPEYHSRVVTLLHGIVASVAGLWQCDAATVDRCRLTMKISAANYALMIWSWGYFAFDLIWCLIYWSNGYVILCHHITALYAVNVYMNKPYAGCTYACTLALMEITNPFLQTRWLLRDSGYGKTLLYYAVEVIYLVMFLCLRGFFCSYLIFKILESDVLDVDEKIISLALYAVSLVFIYEILGYITYKYKNKIEDFKGFANEVSITINETQRVY